MAYTAVEPSLAEGKQCTSSASVSRAADALDRRIGRNIQIRRMGVGVSRRQLADRLGMPLQELVDYEKGRTSVPPAKLAEIASCCMVDVALFFASLDQDPQGRDHP